MVTNNIRHVIDGQQSNIKDFLVGLDLMIDNACMRTNLDHSTTFDLNIAQRYPVGNVIYPVRAHVRSHALFPGIQTTNFELL